jgi:phosphoglycerate dehydrogenase-like enzyme
LPNVISFTPHVGGSTEEAQQEIGAFVAGKAARLRG